MHHKSITLLAGFTLTLALAGASGCEDPAVGKPKAQVGSGQPTAAAQTATAGSPAAAQDKPAVATAGDAWKITPDTSKIEFVGSKVTGKHDGGFKAFTGEVKVAGGKIEGSSVSIEIDTTSVFTDTEKLTGHLKTADFFDVEKHPKASFVSTEIKAGGEDGATHTVVGNLTLHGVTKSISFPATITLDGDKASVKSEFSINRKDFEILYAGKADDLIRDDVVIKLDLNVGK
jgi:polyisoprenoid-binding protein YceI